MNHGWAVTFGIARRAWAGFGRSLQSPLLYQIKKTHPSTAYFFDFLESTMPNVHHFGEDVAL